MGKLANISSSTLYCWLCHNHLIISQCLEMIEYACLRIFCQHCNWIEHSKIHWVLIIIVWKRCQCISVNVQGECGYSVTFKEICEMTHTYFGFVLKKNYGMVLITAAYFELNLSDIYRTHMIMKMIKTFYSTLYMHYNVLQCSDRTTTQTIIQDLG